MARPLNSTLIMHQPEDPLPVEGSVVMRGDGRPFGVLNLGEYQSGQFQVYVESPAQLDTLIREATRVRHELASALAAPVPADRLAELCGPEFGPGVGAIPPGLAVAVAADDAFAVTDRAG